MKMNLAKSFEFFDPEKCKDRIHIIGCGSVGSTVAELLARFGLTNFSLYDFDTVEEHNLVNQMFILEDVGHAKTEATLKHLSDINPEIAKAAKIYPDGYTGQKLSGYVFLCVDNIELRRKIVEGNKYNANIKAMFDFRTALTSGQHYAADWKDPAHIKALLETMDFSHEEAEKNVPVSACKVSLCVAPTVRLVSMVGVTNFVNFVKEGKLETAILTDPFSFMIMVI